LLGLQKSYSLREDETNCRGRKVQRYRERGGHPSAGGKEVAHLERKKVLKKAVWKGYSNSCLSYKEEFCAYDKERKGKIMAWAGRGFKI